MPSTPVVVEALLVAALQALRDGTLRELVGRRPRFMRWLRRHHLAPILGAGLDALGADGGDAQAVEILLHWVFARLRPDRRDESAAIPDDAWLERAEWRPLLAVAGHFGLVKVPEFPQRYRRRDGETAASALCGLWDVGTSSFYRTLQRGKERFARVLGAWPPEARALTSLRAAAHRHVERALRDRGVVDMAAWHLQQHEFALARRDPLSAVWHAARAPDVRLFAATLSRHRIELAGDAAIVDLAREVCERELSTRERFDTLLAQAMLHMARREDSRALRAYGDAMRLADAAGEPLLAGIASRELGHFHESRHVGKALAHLKDGVDILREVHRSAAPDDACEARAEYLAALQLLGWFHVVRSDARSLAILEAADALAEGHAVPPKTVARVQGTWGEYWRRAGRPERALEHCHRALGIYERLGDAREVLSMSNNLCLICMELRDYDQAQVYAMRVVASGQADAYLLASALGNLGAVHFFQERLQEAISRYEESLTLSEKCGLDLIANRAHFNLAEAWFTLFASSRDPQHERLGDRHLALAKADGGPVPHAPLQHFVPALKDSILGPTAAPLDYDVLLPTELAEHGEEMTVIDQARMRLAQPGSPAAHAADRLAIAEAYLAIFEKERQAAADLIARSGLEGELGARLEAMHASDLRRDALARTLRAQWNQRAHGLMTPERIGAVLRQLAQAGAINKSAYASLCGVGLATASKHLGELVQRGLIVQVGKSRSTRYVLR